MFHLTEISFVFCLVDLFERNRSLRSHRSTDWFCFDNKTCRRKHSWSKPNRTKTWKVTCSTDLLAWSTSNCCASFMIRSFSLLITSKHRRELLLTEKAMPCVNTWSIANRRYCWTTCKHQVMTWDKVSSFMDGPSRIWKSLYLFQHPCYYVWVIRIGKDSLVIKYHRQGIATKLTSLAKRFSPAGICTAVLIWPRNNVASHHFKLRNGFQRIGLWKGDTGAKISPIQSEIFVWTPLRLIP